MAFGNFAKSFGVWIIIPLTLMNFITIRRNNAYSDKESPEIEFRKMSVLYEDLFLLHGQENS